MQQLFVKKAGEEQANQIVCDAGNRRLRRKIFSIDMINSTGFGVRCQKTFGKVRNSELHPRIIRQSVCHGKSQDLLRRMVQIQSPSQLSYALAARETTSTTC